MAVTRKPKASPKLENPVDVHALIQKGGSIAGEHEPDTVKTAKSLHAEKLFPVVLRIPISLLEGIEQERQKRTVKVPRHTWLLEAIAEKLDRASS